MKLGDKEYRVTIDLRERTETDIGHEWKIGADPSNGEDGYGYTPSAPGSSVGSKEIFCQTVTELDMAKLVMIVNGLG